MYIECNDKVYVTLSHLNKKKSNVQTCVYSALYSVLFIHQSSKNDLLILLFN